MGAGHALLEQAHIPPSRNRVIPPLPEGAQLEGAAMSLEAAVEYALAS
jgi:hypothetical protein